MFQNSWVEGVLGLTIERDAVDLPNATGRDPDGLDLADYWKAAIAAFGVASREVDKQISALQSALRETGDPEMEDIADFGLNALMQNTRVPLLAALRDMGEGKGLILKTYAPRLRATIMSFHKVLATNPKIAACDNNPLGVVVSIRDTYDDALELMLEVVQASTKP
jgi:hypothetical protein